MSSLNIAGQLSPLTLAKIIFWARQAGQIALCYFNNVSPISKPDQTLLTQADLEIEQFLVERIRATFPNHKLIAEEGSRDDLGQDSPYTWIIDPIDGTTAFSQGLPGWGIAIGLLFQERPYFGLYYMPLLDDMTYTNNLGEVYCNGRKLVKPIHTNWGQKGFLAVNAAAHAEFHISRTYTRALGSISTNLVYTARGTATAAFIPKARLWDLVAGAAIIMKAGGELRYLSGESIRYGELMDGRLASEPIIAGHPNILAELPGVFQLY